MAPQEIDVRRVVSALFVVLLHAALLVVLLRAAVAPGGRHEEAREMLLRLLRSASPPVPEPSPAPRLVRPTVVAPAAIVRPPVVDGASLQGLRQSVFGCAPENLASLNEEQRAHCTRLMPNLDQVDALRDPPSRVHDPRHWARALARKQNPVLLPCASPQAALIGIQTVICVGRGIVGGFGNLDERPGYGDEPGPEVHVPNNGDPLPPWSPR